MVNSQATKMVQMVLPQSIGTTAVTGRIDSLNADWVTICYSGDTAAAGDVLTVLKISYGDTTSAFTDMTSAVGGTTFDIPAPNTSTGDIVKFEIDKTKYPYRYFQISITGDATARLTEVFGILSRMKIQPNTDAEAGCTEIVYC